MPYAMIEPMRELLDAGVASDRVEHDERWMQALKEEIEDAEVELSTVLGRGRITMQQLIDLQAGDILPCDFNGRATVLAEDVPIFRGTFGVSHGQQAVQIEERVSRHKPKLLDKLLATKL
jgi:flagellar motor switch protein FliM